MSAEECFCNSIHVQKRLVRNQRCMIGVMLDTVYQNRVALKVPDMEYKLYLFHFKMRKRILKSDEF